MTTETRAPLPSSLSLPSNCHLLFICGDQSGVGKSSVALSILHLLLTRKGYKASEVAYIKPCTQCEDVQLIGKYCHQQQIEHVDLGPIIFYSGYTQECIDGKAPDTEAERHAKIQAAVSRLAQGKRFVLVDGVGYPAVGTVCGVSNATVSRLLSAPVLLVSRPGVGNAIDATCYMQAFFLYNRSAPIGVLYNKIPFTITSASSSSSSHSYERTVEYTTKFFATWTPHLSIYGHVPIVGEEEKKQGEEEDEEERQCMIRGPKGGWELTEKEARKLNRWLATAEQHIDIDRIVADVEAHYQARHSAGPSR